MQHVDFTLHQKVCVPGLGKIIINLTKWLHGMMSIVVF